MSTAFDQAMTDDRSTRKAPRFPRLPLYGMMTVLAISIGLIVLGQKTGIGVVKDEVGSPINIRDIVFFTDEADVIHVSDLATGEEIIAYPPNEGGFVRGAQRALDRMRLVAKVPDNTPYRLILWDSGILSLSDTGTGQRVYLNAFGRDNVGAFGALLGEEFGLKKTTANAATTTEVETRRDGE